MATFNVIWKSNLKQSATRTARSKQSKKKLIGFGSASTRRKAVGCGGGTPGPAADDSEDETVVMPSGLVVDMATETFALTFLTPPVSEPLLRQALKQYFSTHTFMASGAEVPSLTPYIAQYWADGLYEVQHQNYIDALNLPLFQSLLEYHWHSEHDRGEDKRVIWQRDSAGLVCHGWGEYLTVFAQTMMTFHKLRQFDDSTVAIAHYPLDAFEVDYEDALYLMFDGPEGDDPRSVFPPEHDLGLSMSG